MCSHTEEPLEHGQQTFSVNGQVFPTLQAIQSLLQLLTSDVGLQTALTIHK